jgi:hypothetical protein
MPKHIKNISANNKPLIAAILLTLFILMVSLIPVPGGIPQFESEDKLIHAFFYLVLYALWKKTGLIKDLALWAALILFGFSIEVLQDILPVNRHFDLWDMFFNIIGITAGYIGFIFRKKSKDFSS